MLLAGHPVCREAFTYLLGISKRRLTRCRHAFKGLDMRTIRGGFSEKSFCSVKSFQETKLKVSFAEKWYCYKEHCWKDFVISVTHGSRGHLLLGLMHQPHPAHAQELLPHLPWKLQGWRVFWFTCTGVLLNQCRQRPLANWWLYSCLPLFVSFRAKSQDTDWGLLQRRTLQKGVKNYIKNCWSD